MLAAARNLLNLRKLNHIEFFKTFLKNNSYPQFIFGQERRLKALEKFDSRSWIYEIKNPTMVMVAEKKYHLLTFIKSKSF